ncbi:MAG: aldehyde dehydrogenase family protein [Deltaproteobacteria bacterium]|nr:aldehyde dehydrogenase family protein [Deltaproteobacteria bacterium]
MGEVGEIRFRQLFIDGAFRDAASGATLEVIEPATEEVLAEVQAAGAAEVDLAVTAARRAFDDGRWSGLDAGQRARILFEMARILDERRGAIAPIESRDAGKTLFDSGKIEIPFAAELLRYYGGWATKLHGQTSLNKPGTLLYTLRQPVGVVGAIVPWNFPLLMAMWKVAPALAAGCTVVLKPAELTPLSALELADIAREAGLPDGVLNVIPGLGSVAGQALVEHPGVDKIAFTGSTAVGQQVMRTAAGSLKRLSLELGGKSANIVFADADVDAAVKTALTGIFYNKGEVCAAGSRLLVERPIYEQVVEAVTAKAGKLTLGSPLEKTTRMGPLVSAGQLERVLGYIEKGKAEGARLCCGGERDTSATGGKGYFVQPTVFADVDPAATIAREEIFGPVLSVIPFEGEAEAVKIANGTAYGLAAAVHTADGARGHRVAQALKAGTVWINTYNMYDPDLPFGGFGESGFGRELGGHALDLYTETKSVWTHLG